MPDWSYHTIFKPMLSKLPSKVSREFIHNSMNKISTMPFGPSLIEFLGHLNSDSSLENEIHNLKIKNQIGLASKIDPYLSGTNAFMNLGFGVIEIGPISIHDTTTSKTPLIDLKSNQLIGTEENKVLTVEQAVKKLSKIQKKLPIFARIVGSFDEFKMIESRLSDFVDLFILDLDLAADLVKNKWVSTKPICLSIYSDEIDVFPIQENYPFDSILIEEPPITNDLEQKNNLIITIHKLKSKQFEKPIFFKRRSG
ncbi:hypothetical protein V7146_23580 [Gottfriedia acidiceleris]|uniref:hypothetical protein n=1 Tax=Gottfriedia acidiceleris TaxID=371036 RepID=UPI002FFD807A